MLAGKDADAPRAVLFSEQSMRALPAIDGYFKDFMIAATAVEISEFFFFKDAILRTE
jgi:hypothetical protein